MRDPHGLTQPTPNESSNVSVKAPALGAYNPIASMHVRMISIFLMVARLLKVDQRFRVDRLPKGKAPRQPSRA
jgi:hypothetical protein